MSISTSASSAKPASKRPPYRNGSTLSRSLDYWSDEAIAKLLADGSNVNARGDEIGQTPLLFAQRYARFELIVPLLEAGADPFARDSLGHDLYGDLIYFRYKGYMLEVKHFVDHIREPQNLEVIEIIQIGDQRRFAHWLASDPDLEAHWDLTRTPLLWALYYDRESFVTQLMVRGARLDVVDYQGHTPLHFAAMNGNLQLVRALRATGARLDLPNDYGQTPLALSLFAPDLRVMTDLLASGADPCIGPRGKSDVLDLARSTSAGNEERAIRLLSQAVERRSCPVTSEEARRSNASEFTESLKALTSPPGFVLDTSQPHRSFDDVEALREASRGYGRQRGRLNSAPEYRRIKQAERAMGYRVVLAHPDDEAFAWYGASIWAPELDRDDMEIELAIDQLLLKHFFYFQVDKECLLCDPWEDITGVSASMVVHEHADHLVRVGRLLEAVDVSEKFLRERITETTERLRIFMSLVRPLWLLGRHDEAYAVGDAELVRELGSAEGKARRGNRLGQLLDAMLLMSGDNKKPTNSAIRSAAANRARR